VKSRNDCSHFGEIQSIHHIAHDQKPRSIVFNPQKCDIFATSGLDGNLRFWEYQDLQLKDLCSLSSTALRSSRFPTALAWHQDGNKCAALFPLTKERHKVSTTTTETATKPHIYDPQLITFDTAQIPNVSATFLQEKPHDKDPNNLAFLSLNKIVTVGTDKKVVLWDINYDKHGAETTCLHNKHTAGVTTVIVDSNGIIFTGGHDRKCISYSSQSQQVIDEWKMEDRVYTLRFNPVHNNLLLVYLSTKQKQVRIFDIRTQSEVLALSYKMSNPKNSGVSQFIVPSWSSDGTFVASGSVDPILHVWDVRYVKADQPAKSWSLHKKRILRAEFHPRQRNCILTLSSDRTLGCNIFELK